MGGFSSSLQHDNMTTARFLRPRAAISFLLLFLSRFLATQAWTTPPQPIFSITVCDVRNGGFALAIGLMTFVVTDLSNSSPDLKRGQVIFENNCSSCHANGLNKIDGKKTLRRDDIEKFVGLNQNDVLQYMKFAPLHRGALAFGGELNERDLENVVAFVLDQAVQSKW